MKDGNDKMYKIAIVDDQQVITEWIQSIIRKLEKNYLLGTFAFHKSETLLNELREGRRYQIYLLDIDMPDVNGIDLAKQIRKAQPEATFIFVTSYAEYALEGYDVGACQYILKEHMEKKLPIVLYDILEKEKRQGIERFYEIITKYRYEKFRYTDILFIFKEGRNTIFHTKIGEFKERKPIKEVYRNLPQDTFIWIDRGIIVNMDRIFRVRGDEVYFSEEEKLAIGRPHILQVKQQVMNYWGKK